jgi:hypothetical protein
MFVPQNKWRSEQVLHCAAPTDFCHQTMEQRRLVKSMFFRDNTKSGRDVIPNSTTPTHDSLIIRNISLQAISDVTLRRRCDVVITHDHLTVPSVLKARLTPHWYLHLLRDERAGLGVKVLHAWPPLSPDLTHFYFYLRGYTEHVV